MKKILLFAAFMMAICSYGQNYTFQEVVIDSLHGINEGALTHGDIDNDGDEDFMISGDTSSYIGQGSCTAIYLNDGFGNFTKNYNNIVPIHDAFIRFVDVDGDGDFDILARGYSEAFGHYTGYIYRNNGNLGFVQIPGGNIPVVYEGTMDFTDVDGDGDMDAVSSRGSSSETYSYISYNDGTGIFSQAYLNGSCCGISKFADIDGDGDQDLLTSGYTPINTAHTILYVNDSSGNFTVSNGFTSLNFYFQGGFLDMDSDGDMDILLCSLASTSPMLYLNDGNGNYTVSNAEPFNGISVQDIQFGDINADGAPDALVYGYIQSSNEFVTKIFTNNWNNTFTESTINIPLHSGTGQAMELLNIDDDPYLEILISARTTTQPYNNQTVLYDNVSYASIDALGSRSISVIPNPTTGEFQLEGDGLVGANVSLINLSGKKLFSAIYNGTITVPNGSPSGIYYVEVITDEGVFREKLLLR